MDTVWVAVAFFVFVGGLAYLGVHKSIAAALDRRGELIAAELAEARRLREEAAAVLSAYEAKRKAAEAEAEAIVTAAREEAERIAAESEAKLADFIARRTRAAEDKIAQAEAQAEAEVRAAAADAATRAAEIILREDMAGKGGDAIFTAGLRDVKAKLN